MSAAAIDTFEIKTDRGAIRGSHLTGAFRAAFVVLFVLAALFLIAPIIFAVSVLHMLTNCLRRETPARPQRDHIPPIIERDYKIIDDGQMSLEPNDERPSSVSQREILAGRASRASKCRQAQTTTLTSWTRKYHDLSH